MPTRNVVLSDHQHALVESLVQSGSYQNASEVLREGLRLIEQRERLDAAKLKVLQQAANQGWDDIAAGRYVDVANDQLADFIRALGVEAARRVRPAG
ncbi:type II toxin-antitoxin system ParD family antitoxin [Hydrocarboniphaga sp.]|uniref:type II toxin-antitoxin system ParD family antitoxin n=1 Tax=Hydrocarboniphaga sp. TaxID=2033016 RepID=UPI003D138233